ncbi:tetrapyrrole biosynthesis, uroporphyrinogen III synthase [Rhizoclosmatium globosum]|uniref:Tetrapyrrole biosynthesis, uroporphyrinogen III synthase n=1 Tax=Rhizoclosmatium globosum TaxID=329046 RepID=A0A1Y2CSG0_9FUNG|nr:tetrapyrrole biosynthesis, uroporphyrinogen III synthase [Rhizoclosmatium globosum]|eukprot:ORY49315.1 tetrapyrrole biosynthesis, uroporphyrinogen III synthase [Rhizoclosmatium globosum]
MSNPQRKTIVFFRGNIDDEIEAHDAGFDAVNVPVLQTRLTGQTELYAALTDKTLLFDSIVATSKRAIEALAVVWETIDEDIKATWRLRPFYVVGPSSNEFLLQLGLQPFGFESGNAEALANYIIAEGKSSNLLFLRGDKTLNTLVSRLNDAERDIKVESVIVYKTLPIALPQLYATLCDVYARFHVSWFTFFSPSGVKIVVEDTDEDHWNGVKVACIGKTTKAALIDSNIIPSAVAESPNAKSLLAAIINAE